VTAEHHTSTPALAALRQRFGVYVLTCLLSLAAVLIFALLTAGPLRQIAQPQLSWWALAILYVIPESFPVHLSVGKETQSFSLSEVPLLLGLFLATPGDLLIGQAVGSGIALLVRRHQPFKKLTFNLASFAFSTSVAIVVFQFLSGPTATFALRDLFAGFVAALVADFMSGITVQGVIAVSTGQMPEWAGIGAGAIYVLANASLGLVGVLLLTFQRDASWLAAALALAMYGAYRVTERQREHELRLVGLHDATRDVQQALSGSTVAHRLLDRARAMFGAERAELLVLPHADVRATRTTVGPNGESVDVTLDRLATTEGVWARAASEGVGLRMTASEASLRLRAYLDSEGIRDLMAAPVRGEDGAVVAVLTVMNRVGNIGGWREEEVPLLETLANHAGIALRNGELVDGLAARAAENEHQARHDALTDLANRTWFTQLIDAGLASATPPAALLSLDLDRFKEINDTLGHQNGDQILRAVADRLRSVVHEPEVAARLSGDEFALLVWGEDSTRAVADAANRVQRCLEEAFDVSGLTLNVSATIGAAIVGPDAADAGTLLRQADVAMYLAKASHVPLEQYSPERDEYSPARLALAGEFRRAIDSGELVPWYQPKIDVASGRIVGAEALARWIHPVRGLVRPDEFIPIVEQTNLLRPMTLRILRGAIDTFASLNRAGLDLGISVNLSARNLLDPDIARSIASMLRASGLPSERLTVEVTESAVMSDPERAIATLGELRELGLDVSVDDFGTGHASLAYLKRLPVTELKIDKSFITHLANDSSDQSIVRSTIELGHELGLTCVAEGVEDEWTLDWLGAQSCDLAQGFLFSEAVPADEFARLVRLDRLTALAAEDAEADQAVDGVDAQPADSRESPRRRPGIRAPRRSSMTHGSTSGRGRGSRGLRPRPHGAG
jgi:diguanylate cyclase (GGDEF)-like protein